MGQGIGKYWRWLDGMAVSLEKIPGLQATSLYTGRGAQDMGKTRRRRLKALVKAWACAFLANEA
jgi:hypothetical protein